MYLALLLDAVLEQTAAVAETNSATTDETITTIDVIYALRALGWHDAGDPGMPTFEAATKRHG